MSIYTDLELFHLSGFIYVHIYMSVESLIFHEVCLAIREPRRGRSGPAGRGAGARHTVNRILPSPVGLLILLHFPNVFEESCPIVSFPVNRRGRSGPAGRGPGARHIVNRILPGPVELTILLQFPALLKDPVQSYFFRFIVSLTLYRLHGMRASTGGNLHFPKGFQWFALGIMVFPCRPHRAGI